MEFALVALPFAYMIFAIVEIAFVFVLDSVLENATIETGRLVRTGQAQARGFTAAEFKSEMCNRMSVFAAGCTGKLTVDVRVIPQFSNQNPPDPMGGGSFSASGLTYANGASGDIVLVRAWYQHTLFTPFLQQGLSRLGDGQAWLTTTTAFRNEPFDD